MRISRETIDRSQVVGGCKAEVFVGPVSDITHRKQRWRWDVTFWTIADVDKTQPGQLGVEGRRHLHGIAGYTRTWLGAWYELSKAYLKSAKQVV